MSWFENYKIKRQEIIDNKFNEILNEVEILPDEIDQYLNEDLKSFKSKLKSFAKISSTTKPTIEGDKVVWYLTLKDFKDDQLEIFYSTNDLKGFNIISDAFLFTEDNIALFNILLQYKTNFDENWDTRLASND